MFEQKIDRVRRSHLGHVEIRLVLNVEQGTFDKISSFVRKQRYRPGESNQLEVTRVKFGMKRNHRGELEKP